MSIARSRLMWRRCEMKGDPDFNTFKVKINASGSWGNVGVYKTDDYDRVKTACLILAETATSRLKFSTVDAAGGVIEILSSQANGLMWRKNSA